MRYELIAVGLVIGTIVGIPMGLKIPMTKMPERIALSHSYGGLAVALVGIAHYYVSEGHLDKFNMGATGFEVLPARSEAFEAHKAANPAFARFVRNNLKPRISATVIPTVAIRDDATLQQNCGKTHQYETDAIAHGTFLLGFKIGF